MRAAVPDKGQARPGTAPGAKRAALRASTCLRLHKASEKIKTSIKFSRHTDEEASGHHARHDVHQGRVEEATPGPGSAAEASQALWRKLQRVLQHPRDASVFALAGPSLLALAADPLLSMVDTACVGQIDASSLAALGVNTGLFSVAFLIFNFLGTATTPLIARAAARGDKEAAGAVAREALRIAVVLGALSTVAMELLGSPLLVLMGADHSQADMFDSALSYLSVRALAAPAVFTMMVGQGTLRGLKDTVTPLAITVAANGLNLGLDVLLIFGMHQGVAGAGAATVAAEWLAAGLYVVVLARSESIALWPPPSGPPSALVSTSGDRRAFAEAGGAVLMRTALLLGTKTLATSAATRLGTVPLAAHQVVSQLWMLTSLLVDSLAVAGQALVAVDLGRGDRRAAREVSERLLQLGTALGVVLALASAVASPHLASLFSSDPEVVDAAMSVLPIATASMPVNAVVYVLDGVMVGASEFAYMATAMVGAAGCAVAALVAAEGADMGLEGVWACLAVLMAGRAATLLWRFHSPNSALHVPPEGDGSDQSDGVQGQRAGRAGTPSGSTGVPWGGEVGRASNATPWRAAEHRRTKEETLELIEQQALREDDITAVRIVAEDRKGS